MADINLLPSEEKTSEKFELLRKRLSVFSILVLIITAVFTLATLTLFTTYAKARTEIIASVQEASQRINSFKASEELVVVIKGKVSSANQIISSRRDTSEFLEKLGKLVPQGVFLTDLRLLSDKMVISGGAATSSDMASFASSLVSASGAEIVFNISVDSLVSDETGKFSFIISAQLAGGQKK